MNKLRTVNDLKKYMQSRKISPEQLAEEARISNMTIRRMLKKEGSSRIPERYHAQFEEVLRNDLVSRMGERLSPGGESFEAFVTELEDQGRTVKDLDKLQRELDSKLLDPGIGATLKDLVTTLVRSLTSDTVPTRYKMIAVGTLLYLINPFDLIPDAIPVVGYLDDFAALTLAVGLITGTIRLGGIRGKPEQA